MELTKQQVIDQLLSFNYSQLAEWMTNRLKGKDEHFPVNLGHDPNLGEFLDDVFHHIKDEGFRRNFLEILADLTAELKGFPPRQLEESRRYISELLYLCGSIERFDNKTPLLEIAVAGNFKGIEIEENDLHAILLTTLASFKIAGTSEFWIKQLLDHSDKRYANPAFYALADYPHKLFRHIGVFIDNFQGETELDLGLMYLIEQLGKKEVYDRFHHIARSLSQTQKKTVNQALENVGYTEVFPRHRQQVLKRKLGWRHRDNQSAESLGV